MKQVTRKLCGNAACASAILTSSAQAAEKPSATCRVDSLRCEYRESPLGIDILTPRLSWVIESDRRGMMQSAYQVLVSSSAELLAKDSGDLWDSGKTTSDRSIHVEYAGKPLKSREVCFWKVRVWDDRGQVSIWSRPALWSMGLLKLEDWQARWIGYDSAYYRTPEQVKDDALFNIQGLKWVQMPSPRTDDKSGTRMPDNEAGTHTHLRKQIELPSDRRLKRAVLALYAFNECVARVNGADIGRAAHWEPTARLDATKALQPGTNVVALTLSHTDPYLPAAIGRLVLQFESGNDEVLPLDQTWKASEQAAVGWDKVGFDDSAWVAAQVLNKHPWKGFPTPVADLARVPAPYLRKEFTVDQEVKRATVYVTALGTYELHLNGKRVSADVLAPGWTEFGKRVHYQTYDVTAQVVKGSNALGAILGDGWYASTLAHLARRNLYGGTPRFLAQLEVEFADGSTKVVSTDDSWKASYGPIRHADLLMGCEYDARLVMPGWDRTGFDDRAWNPVVFEPLGIAGHRIQSAVAEPARVIEELSALTLTEPKPRTWTFDLGQNMAGWVRLKVCGAAGQRITVRHGEMLNTDGTIYTASLRSCPAADFFVLAGTGEEVLEPYFTSHGFRYVEIRGLDVRPALDAVTGLVVHTPMRCAGRFESSHGMLNKLYSNIVWSQKGNYLEIVSDCPQRDERMGWGCEAPTVATTGSYNFDVAAFFTRWLQTWEDCQRENGAFNNGAPDIMHLKNFHATAWSDTPLILTYLLYRSYGDTRVVSERFAALERYMQWLNGKTVDGGITKVGGFGDWLNLGGGAKIEAIDTAYHAYLARIMSEMAVAIGRHDAAATYAKRHEEVKSAFAKHFLQDDGNLKDCSQTGYALAFSMDLLPPEMREKAAEKFIDEIKRFDWHPTVGNIGNQYLLPALSRIGRDDVAYRLLLTDTYPSWLFMVKNGATTVWERMDSWTPDKGFQTIDMNSFNHPTKGSVGEYLYGGIGGIQPASPGYKTIRIQPVIREGLTWAKTRYDSIHGMIATDWTVNSGKLELEVRIPANTAATVHVPAKDAASVTESGKPASAAEGVKFLRLENGAALYEVGSGTYRFGSSLPQ